MFQPNFTIGAGIGAGIIGNGQDAHGLIHLKKAVRDGIIKNCGITTASSTQFSFFGGS